MRRFLWPWLLVTACGPLEATGPFVKVTLLNPDGFTAPAAGLLLVNTSAVLDGSPISNINEISVEGDALPTSFVIRFSEPVRGSVVNFDIQALQNGVSVYSAQTSSVADASEIELVVSFCGDNAIDPTRSETCDDGAANSDTAPNACRADCQTAFCGDGVLDSGEACDDGNNTDAVFCDAECSLPACNNGIVDPEDFDNIENCFFEEITKVTSGIPISVLIEDLNGDGIFDLIASIDNVDSVGLFLGENVTIFQDEQLLNSQSGAALITTGDVIGGNIGGNPDGLIDVLSFAGFQETGISVFQNNGQGLFVENQINQGIGVSNVATGDFDGDLKDEIIFTDSNLNMSRPNPDRDGFDLSELIDFTKTPGLVIDFGSLLSDDWNNDGSDDLIVIEVDSSSSITKANVLLGGSQNFSESSEFQVPAGAFSNFGLISANSIDADNDGEKDIVILDDVGQRVFFQFGNGQGQFPSGTFVPLTTLAISMITEDFDQDGLTDIAVLSNVNEELITVLLQKEDFLFEHKVNIDFISGPLSMVSRDLNQDGFPDLVVGSGIQGGAGEITVLLFKP